MDRMMPFTKRYLSEQLLDLWLLVGRDELELLRDGFGGGRAALLRDQELQITAAMRK